MIRILHLITDLDVGGAEMMLFKLLSGMDRGEFLSRIITLQSDGVLSQATNKLGIQVDSLHVNPYFPNPLALLSTLAVMRQWRPHVVQTWMYHADLLGTLAWLFSRVGVLIWNMRCTNMDFSQYNPMTRWVVKMCAVLSGIPRVVAANSHAAVGYHQELGYHPARTRVIPNGFDLKRFRPNPLLKTQMRKALDIPEDQFCLGLIARFDPMKDHSAFFSAAAMIEATRQDVHFILCGEGVTRDNPKMDTFLHNVSDAARFHLLGRREDIPVIAVGLDLLLLTSKFGESFPNVIGEAMACGVPCVVTDVGDSARIVGDTGGVVPPGDPAAMTDAVLRILSLPPQKRRQLGLKARKRIETHYSLKRVVQDYTQLYRDIVNQADF